MFTSSKRILAAALAALLTLTAGLAPAFAAAGVDATVLTRIQGAYAGANDLGTVAFSFDKRTPFAFVPGTGTGQADKLFSDTRTLAASATEDLDLAGGLTDPLGSTLTFVKIKAIYIKASAANTNSVVIGAAASNDFVGPWSADGTTSIPPGGELLLVHGGAGWTVTASTGDLLKIANSSSGTGVTFDIILIGTSA